MCSSRLAGAQQPTVLLSLKSRTVAALSQDLQLHLWAKQMAGKRAAGAKWPCHFFSFLAQKSQCNKPCPHLSLPVWKKTSSSLHSPPSIPHDPPSSTNNPKYSQHAGNNRQPNIPNKLETTKTPKTTMQTHRDVWSQLPTDFTDLPRWAGASSAQWSLALKGSRGAAGRRTISMFAEEWDITDGLRKTKKCFLHNSHKKSGLNCNGFFFFCHTTIIEFRNLVAAWYLVVNIYLIHWKYFSLPFREAEAKTHSGTTIGITSIQGENNFFSTNPRTNKMILYSFLFLKADNANMNE